MKNTRILTAGLGLWFSLVSASAFAQGVTTFAQGGASQKCGGADIANGPFNYSTPSITQTTFNGMNGSPITTSFSITAPSVDPKHNSAEVIDVFPGQGQTGDCSPIAFATISALEISKVGDATGNLLVDAGLARSVFWRGSDDCRSVLPVAEQLHVQRRRDDHGQPRRQQSEPAAPRITATTTSSWPPRLRVLESASATDLHFFLSLRAVTATDTTLPVVSVTKPSGDEILGVIGVEVTAFDPDGPVASGLASISASVSSAGGTVSGLPISLAFNPSLPQPAGVVVTGTGSFTPTGGAPGSTEGTTDAAAFTSNFRSGIGSYTINAQASDVAGNIGYGSKSFIVKYDVAFTGQSVPAGCNAGNLNPCAGRFKFTVRRSNVTSDGAFMFDHTVVVKLVRVSDNGLAATHVFGTRFDQRRRADRPNEPGVPDALQAQ